MEGPTDKIYIERVLSLHLPNIKVVVESCGGDIATRLSFWASSLGDLQLSPYRRRTFVIYDRVTQAGLEKVSKRIGLPHEHMVQWENNGVEYVYPDMLLSSIYRRSDLTSAQLQIDNDIVSYGDLAYKKMELCKMVTKDLVVETQLPRELQIKLIDPIRQLTERDEIGRPEPY